MLTSSQKTAYIQNRFIGEYGRLICDIKATSNWFNIEGFLVNMNLENVLTPFSYFRLEYFLTTVLAHV